MIRRLAFLLVVAGATAGAQATPAKPATPAHKSAAAPAHDTRAAAATPASHATPAKHETAAAKKEEKHETAKEEKAEKMAASAISEDSAKAIAMAKVSGATVSSVRARTQGGHKVYLVTLTKGSETIHTRVDATTGAYHRYAGAAAAAHTKKAAKEEAKH